MGGFVVYDITDKASLDHCKKWKKEIDEHVLLRNGNPIPTVLIGNKVLYGLHMYDLVISCISIIICMQIDITHDSNNEVMTQYDGEQFCREHNFDGYFKTSAKYGAGIRDAIHFMIMKVSIHYTYTNV